MLAGTPLSHYDGVSCDTLAARAGVPRLVALDHCASTMDVVHTLAAEGAAQHTAVVAEEQRAGRGRSGKHWTSQQQRGVWASVLLREPVDGPTGVLSLRTGMALARALAPHAALPIRLKWPNDLFTGDAKLAGILTEARWRGEALEWIVVGVGVNVGATSAEPGAASLVDARLSSVLVDVARAVLSAAALTGPLTTAELAEFASRDFALGRAVTSPLDGTVLGISSTGGVRVRTSEGEQVAVAGSLVFRPS